MDNSQLQRDLAAAVDGEVRFDAGCAVGAAAALAGVLLRRRLTRRTRG